LSLYSGRLGIRSEYEFFADIRRFSFCISTDDL
jgi:hypothetical protein